MSLRRLPWFALLLVPLVGCGPQAVPAPPTTGAPVIPAAPPVEPAKPLIKPVAMTDDDWKHALPRSYPDQLRGGKTDEALARELDLQAVALEFRGGPIHWWFDVQEQGQTTLPADRPAAKCELTAPEGRLVVSVGRGASERMKGVMQKAGKDAFPESIPFKFSVRSGTNLGGGTSIMSHGGNPLWFGWPGDRDVKSTTFTIETAKVGDTVTVLTLTCEEPMPADKAKPKKVTVSLKAKYVSPDAPKPEGK